MSTLAETALPEIRPRRRPLRSIGAVAAGFAAIAVASTAVDAVMHATGIFPPWGQAMAGGLFALALAYRLVISIGGSYLTARLALHRPLRHALALGVLGVLVSLAGTVATWNRGPEFGPKWYPILLVVLAIPCAWAGGWLRTTRS